MVKNEIPSITNLATTGSLSTKINEAKNKVPNITDLATTTAVNVAENKLPNVSDLVKKTDYDVEIKNITNKYFTTSDCNKFVNNTLDVKITQRNN